MNGVPAPTPHHLEKVRAWWYSTLLLRTLGQPGTLEEAMAATEAAFALVPWPDEIDLAAGGAAGGRAALPPLTGPPEPAPTPPAGKKLRGGITPPPRLQVYPRRGAPKWKREGPPRIFLATSPDDWASYKGPRGGKGWKKVKAEPPGEKAEELPPVVEFEEDEFEFDPDELPEAEAAEEPPLVEETYPVEEPPLVEDVREPWEEDEAAWLESFDVEEAEAEMAGWAEEVEPLPPDKFPPMPPFESIPYVPPTEEEARAAEARRQDFLAAWAADPRTAAARASVEEGMQRFADVEDQRAQLKEGITADRDRAGRGEMTEDELLALEQAYHEARRPLDRESRALEQRLVDESKALGSLARDAFDRRYGLTYDEREPLAPTAVTFASKAEEMQVWGAASAFLSPLMARGVRGVQPFQVVDTQTTATPGAGCFYDPGVIYLQPAIGASAGVHEFGHHLEQNPAIWRRVMEFRNRRFDPADDVDMNEFSGLSAFGNMLGVQGKTGNPDRLEGLFGMDMGYGLGLDASLAAYVGVRYGPAYNRDTEILSSGLELLYMNPAVFARQDPEYFDLIMDILQRPGGAAPAAAGEEPGVPGVADVRAFPVPAGPGEPGRPLTPVPRGPEESPGELPYGERVEVGRAPVPSAHAPVPAGPEDVIHLESSGPGGEGEEAWEGEWERKEAERQAKKEQHGAAWAESAANWPARKQSVVPNDPSQPLPDDEGLAGAAFDAIDYGRSLNMGSLFAVRVGGQDYFYKALTGPAVARTEQTVSELLSAAGFAAPRVRAAAPPGHMPNPKEKRAGVLSDWQEGVTGADDPNGFLAAVRKDRVGAQTQALFNALVGIRDRHAGNYMVTPDGRVVSVDHEMSLGSLSLDDVVDRLAMDSLWRAASGTKKDYESGLAPTDKKINKKALARVVELAEPAAAAVEAAGGYGDQPAFIRKKKEVFERLLLLDAPTIDNLSTTVAELGDWYPGEEVP